MGHSQGLDIRRRLLLALASATAATRTFAQTIPTIGTRPFRIGVLSDGPPAAMARLGPIMARGLAQQGFLEGQHVHYDLRAASGDQAQSLKYARDLVESGVDILFAPSTRPAIVLKQLTSTIPIVFESGDPVGAGLVTSIERPGGNVTGLLIPLADLAAERVRILHELLPDLEAIHVLWNPRAPTTREQKDAALQAANTVGIRATALDASDAGSLGAALDRMTADGARAFLTIQDPFFLSTAERLAEFAAGRRIAGSHSHPRFPIAGGLFSYSPNLEADLMLVGHMMARILRGESPAGIPVVRTQQFQLTINRTAAGMLGISIPERVRARGVTFVG